MSVLSVQALAKYNGERLVFSGVSFRVARGDRVGIVGPNGTGKSTLLRIVARREEADAGRVALTRGTRVGLLEQELLGDVPGTVAEHARGAGAHIRELGSELRELESSLASGDPEVLRRYADTQHAFEHAGGYDFEATVKRVLEGLGLASLADREVATLSGGEHTRLGLARLLLDDPDLLLLDEPTNHLDIAALEWLERFLVERDLTVVLVSHDRYFLDRVTSRTLSFEGGSVVEYRGGYSRYARQRAEREAAQARAAERQADGIARSEEFIRRYGAGQRSKEARGRAKKLARVERIDVPAREARHGWRLDAAHLASDVVAETTALAIGYDRSRPILRTPPLQVRRGARVAVVGPNGAGKTTLVRTLIGEVPALEGYVSSAPTARVAYLAQAQRELTSGTVLDALREASGLDEQGARSLLARSLFRGEDVFKDVAVLSGGERTRLALARLAAREANLLVLDEPTNHLDIAAREALESVLAAYEGAIVLVTHDRYLIDKLATEVWLVERGALTRHEGDWTSLQRPRAAATVPPPRRAPRRERPAAMRRAPVKDPAALEARIADLEARLASLERRLAEVAASGNYMETRRVGEEHASVEAALRELYESWAGSDAAQ